MSLSDARDAARPRLGFRPDIQGLRAIAVMLYHCGVSALSGGFVGVDVFFVILGFLITAHLLEALEREGRSRFGAFYAKRARRILPAALLVALLSVLAAWIRMSPLLIQDVLRGADGGRHPGARRPRPAAAVGGGGLAAQPLLSPLRPARRPRGTLLGVVLHAGLGGGAVGCRGAVAGAGVA